MSLPGGNTMNMGIRTIGYGYYDPKIVGEKIVAVSKLLDGIKNDNSMQGHDETPRVSVKK